MAQCIYSTWEGECTMFDEGTASFPDGVGWEETGVCVVEDDPDPSYTCQYFESADPEWEPEE